MFNTSTYYTRKYIQYDTCNQIRLIIDCLIKGHTIVQSMYPHTDTLEIHISELFFKEQIYQLLKLTLIKTYVRNKLQDYCETVNGKAAGIVNTESHRAKTFFP